MQVRRYSTKLSTIEERFKQKLSNEQRRFEYDNQRAIGLTKIPRGTPKSAIDIAHSEPWKGEESPIQLSQRMLEDAIKPIKIPKQKRLRDARENVLDYTLDKDKEQTRSESLQSSRVNRSMRSAGRSMSAGLSSGGWVESIAGMEIENAAKMGVFDSIRRGVQSADLHQGFIESNRNPNIDFTEYLLNNIIKKQGGAPPWIMKQQAVKSRIAYFRNQMKFRLQEMLVPKLLNHSKNDVSKAIKLAKSGSHNKDPEWEDQYALFHNEFVSSLNSQIRGYNLQAPQTARWGYLNLNEEIDRCYESASEGIDEKIKKYSGTLEVAKLNKKELHSRVPPVEDPSKHYGLKEMFRDLFGSKRQAN